MFTEMRRKDRQLTNEEAFAILQKCNYGILSVLGEHGYPYGVPINYAYADGKIYFHSTSQESHKLDAIRENNKVCFTAVSEHDIVLDELSTNYESVIVFGTARILDEPSDRVQAMANMMSVLGRGTEYANSYHCGATNYVMVEIAPEHITGKARRS